MTTESGIPDVLRDLPAWTPSPAELADLELLLTGAFAPLTGFQGSLDAATVLAGGRLADGTPWPVPVTLTVPKELTGEPRVVLQDPEGVPLAVLEVTEAWQTPSATTIPAGPGPAEGDDWHLAGPVRPVRAPAHGPFHRLRRDPAEVRAELGPGPVLAVTTRDPLHRKQLGQLRQEAERLAARVLVLPLLGSAHDESLVRSLLAVRKELPEGALLVPVPLPARADEGRDLLLRSHVAAAYGATFLLADLPAGEAAEAGTLPVVTPEPWAYDADVEVWRPTAKIEPDHVQAELTPADLGALLDRGDPIPDWFTPPAVAAELRAARPPRHRRGVTVFFTGLSGSGKSTVARGLADALVERGGRTITLLDGDVVRRLLSSGLTFSKADRDLNIRRIGYVAAEVTRHGGLAICAPIAPYAATRAEVRRMVSEVGDFVLVHVATPLAECERRDRKGLYAKARAGLIPEFTGISDPYEEPGDADLVLDTSQLAPEAAVRAVLELLVSGGWIRPE
ncbi:adenylyl-sulfate kinase [Actinomadura scrupuli]|uniref:adenylyl-sulfate kinase n=1 Tax=Actinomadura scrupuli TaxID=559629 RepID=UPI003D976CEE